MHVNETLDTNVSFRKWISGNGLDASYMFVMAKTNRGFEQSPPDFQLNGMRMEDKKREIEELFGKNIDSLEGLMFEVMFNSIDSCFGDAEYSPEFKNKRIVEMHFSRKKCNLKPQLTPGGARFYWQTWGLGSSKDEGDLLPKEALAVFAGISKIAIKYVEEYSPNGIMLGTRSDAKESRSGIYKMIAKKLANQRAKIYTLEKEPRPELKNALLIWFSKEEF